MMSGLNATLLRSTLIAAVATVLAASSAWAQPAASSNIGGAAVQSTNSPQQLGEVTVTATRVATAVERTPVAINVYTGADLLAQSITSLASLQNVDPTINITQAGNSPYIAIRGVSSSNTTEVGQPSVSVAHDGFFVNRTFDLDMSMYDLQRVEIDKGPQGTLFGRNSTGGVINIVSAAPVLGKIDGYVNLNVGNYSTYDGEGAISLPIGDTLAVRLSLFDHNRSGYIHVNTPYANYWGDDDRAQSGRFQMFWKPSNTFDFLARYQRDHLLDYGQVGVRVIAGQFFSPSSAASSVAGYTYPDNQLNGSRWTWVANVHHLPFDSVLTYQGGVAVEDWHEQLDNSTPPAPPTNLPVRSQYIANQHVTTWNHELRVATSQDKPVFAQIGVFYFSELNQPLNSYVEEFSSPYVGQQLIAFHYRIETTSRAAFGQLGFNLPANLQATLGYRYTYDALSRLGPNLLNCQIAGIPPFAWAGAGCVGTPPIKATFSNGSFTQSKPTYHVGLQWNATADNMFYAKYDTGYKDGGFDTAPNTPNITYGPEIVRALEIGTKNYFFHRSTIVNADIFDQDYIGYQANLPLPGVIPPTAGITNFGSARIYGLELQINSAFGRNDRVNINSTFMHAHFGSGLPPVENYSTSLPLVDVSGNELPNSPPVVVIASYEHDFAVGSGKLTLRLQSKYSDSFYFDIYDIPQTESPSYTLGDAMLIWNPANQHWNVQAYVKNITNKYTFSSAALATSGTGVLTETYGFNPPRTYGVQGTWHF